MAEEKRATFNQVPELYDQVRPRYPVQLFDDLVALSGVPESGRILEVGAGTGIATLPLAERGYEIVAVEFGADLAAVAAAKLAKFKNVEVVVADFEEWPLPHEPFDLVTSATPGIASIRPSATGRQQKPFATTALWRFSAITTLPGEIKPSSSASRIATSGSCLVPTPTSS